jgi:hypothetical protein
MRLRNKTIDDHPFGTVYSDKIVGRVVWDCR